MDPRITTAARYQQQKNYPAAEQIYRRLLLTEPKNFDALLLLGLLLHETSRNEESVEILRRAMKVQPHRAEVRQTITGPLLALGRLAEAIVEARELTRLRPLVADVHLGLAKLLVQADDPVGALPHGKRAIELQPESSGAFAMVGRIFLMMKSTADAITALDRALSLDPNNTDALIDKAILRQSQGQIDEAIALYEAGLRIAPKNVAALNNLGSCYLNKMRAGDAIRCFEAAAQLWPTDPRPRNNIGAVLKEIGHIDESIPHFKQALQIDPTYADAFCNIGAAYATIGEHKLSIEASRQSLRLKPDYAEVRSNLLLSMLSPTDISPAEVFSEHVEWERAHAAKLRNPSQNFTVDSVSNRRIRIGYVSADFREHSVRYFIEPILQAHDRSQFEIVCYATGRRRDEVTDRLEKLVDAWYFVAELTDQQLADFIRSHRIDILVDLAGHTSDHRLMTFARKPAPVQVTYLGYPTTTGLTAMDYRLTDSITDPPGADVFYSEKLIRLPNAFFVYADDKDAWFDPNLPADRNGFFTFGSFNSFTKINDETLDSWATILRGVPNSRLFMKARPLENPSTRQRVLNFFSAHGVTPDRLDLRAWVSMSEHTSLLGSAMDLMLDSFPYNGHTTSCQAIWRGVPVITRSGDTFRSRVGECILHHLNLADFIGRSKQEYEQIAIRTAMNLQRLRELRPMLRQQMQRSPLCDAGAFTRALEAGFRQLVGIMDEPHSGDDWFRRGLTLHQKQEIADAARAYEKAIAIQPDLIGAVNNLGACYLQLSDVERAIPILQRAAQLNPTEPSPRNNLGSAMEDLQRFDEAIEQYQAANAIDPAFLDSINNLAGCYASIGEHNKAVDCYRRALQIAPDFAIAHSNLLLTLIQQNDVPEETIFAEHKLWDEQHATPLQGKSSPPAVDLNSDRQLRIGYVSPDFREHSVRYFIEPILKAHDRAQVQVFCYAVSPRQDAVTVRLQTLADHWRNAGGWDDQQLAEQIRADQIDVLIDLAGHTSEHRLLAFARSPAPVQITYLGYPATTGMKTMQYRLTDSIADPVGSESFCTEELIRLPKTFFVFNGDAGLPYQKELPAHRNGYVTFGSINNFSKIGSGMLQTWADILKAVPNSRLVLIAKAMNNRRSHDEVEKLFADRGIAADRIDLLKFQGFDEYYHRLSGMDLTLDPYPFNGHTTTCQSLWMGMPVLTRAGNLFRSRVGKSVLSHLEMTDFVADSNDQYVTRAIALATDLNRLAELRPILRNRMQQSALCDALGFTRSLERVYRELWTRLTRQ